MTLPYEEGTWFAVPFRYGKGAMARGLLRGIRQTEVLCLLICLVQSGMKFRVWPKPVR